MKDVKAATEAEFKANLELKRCGSHAKAERVLKRKAELTSRAELKQSRETKLEANEFEVMECYIVEIEMVTASNSVQTMATRTDQGR